MTRTNIEILETIKQYIDDCLPQLSINCVIFKYEDNELNVLIMQPVNSDLWLIPGGYIKSNESIDLAAKRIINEQASIQHSIFNQFGTFGDEKRCFPVEIANGFKNIGKEKEIINWLSKRFVTIGYYSILENQNAIINPGLFFQNFKWVSLSDLSQLAMDHKELVIKARETLAKDVQSKPVLLKFLPHSFTIPTLQKLYESILNRSIDRGNFRQRILKSNILEKVGIEKNGAKRRPPDLYKISKPEYIASLSDDIKLGF